MFFPQSAIFDFPSLLTVILLFICTCAYLRSKLAFINHNKRGGLSVFYKAAIIGDRLSPYVSVACLIMAVHVLFFK